MQLFLLFLDLDNNFKPLAFRRFSQREEGGTTILMTDVCDYEFERIKELFLGISLSADIGRLVSTSIVGRRLHECRVDA